MFERERTDPQQTDIEFDFFDEPPTVEAPGRERTIPRRGPRLPTRPPTGAQPSLFRLGILIAGAILLAVVLVIWVQSCREGQKKAEYRSYMDAVRERATESETVGKQLNKFITTPGIKLSELRDELDGLRQHSAQILASAREVVYADLFYEGSRVVMSKEDIQGIPIPESTFVQNGDLASPSAWTLIVD